MGRLIKLFKAFASQNIKNDGGWMIAELANPASQKLLMPIGEGSIG
jgi:hypothetical protein